jgi:hypothetical protein
MGLAICMKRTDLNMNNTLPLYLILHYSTVFFSQSVVCWDNVVVIGWGRIACLLACARIRLEKFFLLSNSTSLFYYEGVKFGCL